MPYLRARPKSAVLNVENSTHVQNDLNDLPKSIFGRGSAACDGSSDVLICFDHMSSTLVFRSPKSEVHCVANMCSTYTPMKQFYVLQLSDQIGEESMFVWPKGVSPSVQMHVFPQRTCEAYERRKLQFGIADL